MKALSAIIKQNSVFLNRWKHKIDIIADFEGIYMTYEEYVAETPPYSNAKYYFEKKAQLTKAIKKYDDIHVILASYGTPSYEGYAFVLFVQDGKLYEVNGSHCSCYGLEGQWLPEETTLEAIEYRLTKGTLGRGGYDENPFYDELCELLGIEL